MWMEGIHSAQPCSKRTIDFVYGISRLLYHRPWGCRELRAHYDGLRGGDYHWYPFLPKCAPELPNSSLGGVSREDVGSPAPSLLQPQVFSSLVGPRQ